MKPKIIKQTDAKNGTIRLAKYDVGQRPFALEVFAPLLGDFTPYASFATLKMAESEMELSIERFGGLSAPSSPLRDPS